MVIVRCLILCSKFAKNRLSAEPAMGAYSTPPGPLAGSGGGRERRDGKAGGEGEGSDRGEGGEGKEARGGGRERGREKYPLRMKILATALDYTDIGQNKCLSTREIVKTARKRRRLWSVTVQFCRLRRKRNK